MKRPVSSSAPWLSRSLVLAASLVLGPWSLVLAPSFAADAKLTPQELQFFETKIRPVLADHCYKCHSAGSEKIKGGLVLDTKEGWVKGGDSGPAIVPGKPDDSLLIRAVRYKEKDLEMPPSDKKLPDAVIADLEAWVRMGAPDPRTGAAAVTKYEIDFTKAKEHWAFRPVTKPAVPAVADAAGWVKSPIDSFILAKLTEKGLTPSAPADKTTLLRRATFDLTGLPPTPKELDAFLADSSPDAYPKVIERLLKSPHYGERWGRYWLDLAKYGETKGQLNQRDNRYVYAYTYRDWVVSAFNRDLPYDQFLLLQMAADKLPLKDQGDLAAMGFLTLGNRFNNSRNDIIDDRIDLIGKATMGLTLACARCHDHKFDPIQTKDYYALHGVFASSVEPEEEPLLVEPKDSDAEYRDFLRELDRQKEIERKWYVDYGKTLSDQLQAKAGDYLLALYEHKHSGTNLPRNTYFQRKNMQADVAGAWDNLLRNFDKKHHPVLTPWIEFAKLPPAQFQAKSRELAAKFSANKDKAKPINPLVALSFQVPPTSMAQIAARYNALFADVTKRWHALHDPWLETKRKAGPDAKLPPEPAKLPDAPREEIRQVLLGKGAPAYLDEARVASFARRDNTLRNRMEGFERAINDVKIKHPGSPARAHVMKDAPKPSDSYVMLRGNPASRGPVVPRQFLQVLSDGSPTPFKDGSGRLELARAIATADNPLTSRVIANRIWQYHFGEALVRTQDDFGTRGETPTHPELLDWLAATFIEQGWSFKKMHRLIMLSSVYMQSSDDDPRKLQVDPDNKLLWQMNRRRLDFEGLRDTILAIGGKLDLTVGGPSVNLAAEPYPTRRTIYGYVDRARLPGMMQAFDFASPDLTTGKRSDTIVPQQALFMMNSALVVEQARNLAQRPDFLAKRTPEERVKMLYQLIYQRAPRDAEMRMALDYVKAEGASSVLPKAGEPLWLYGYGEIDPVKRTPEHFIVMNTFNRSWSAQPVPGDNRVPSVNLSSNGGFAVRNFAVIRRWIAPKDAIISIDGALSHGNKAREAMGAQARVILNHAGVPTVVGGPWTALRSSAKTVIPKLQVRAGDTLDFVTDVRGNPKGDSFGWTPLIRTLDNASTWNAGKEFGSAMAPDRMNAWEKFAQILLQTNELTFIN
jgi:hypothetical protein